MEQFKQRYLQLDRDVDVEFSKQLDGMRKDINLRLQNTFLKNVDAKALGTGMSLVFSMAPGYRELYKYHLLLLRGLTLHSDIFSISQKDLALLYEYWCFIKLNAILRQNYELKTQDIIKFKGNGLFITLVKGEQASKVVYSTKNGKDKIVLTYNQAYRNGVKAKTATVNQKPDNVLKIVKSVGNGSKDCVKYEYVFDAKYRLDSSEYYIKTYGTAGPPEDTINTMHRYRDAIVSENSENHFERLMYGAYILFPYKDEEKFKENHFYKSIKKVNVGAMPFLPSSSNLVANFLDELINETTDQADKRAVLQIGMEEKFSRFWIASELYEWITVGTTEHKEMTYNDWKISMDEGVIRFVKNGNVVGVYAMEYLKQKGKAEVAIEESFELASRK